MEAPKVGDKVKSREGFEGTVTGFGEPYLGLPSVIVEGKGGKVNTYQPAFLEVTEAAPQQEEPQAKSKKGKDA